MDSYECRQISKFELVRWAISTHDNSPQFHVNFNFFSKVIVSEWILREYSTEPQFLRQFHPDLVGNSVILSLRQFLCYEETRQALEEVLRHLNLVHGVRQNLIEYAWGEAQKAWETVDSEPTCHKILHLNFHVTMEHKHVFYETSLVVHRSIQESHESFMVPAVDRSIESLNRKPTDPGNVETCSICLENFSGEDSCEDALSMPCSHVFHGHCIKKWLRTSHYCPLCRFKMPTS